MVVVFRSGGKEPGRFSGTLVFPQPARIRHAMPPRKRRLDRPWFALPDPWARGWLLRDSPAAFRERNLFTTECAIQRV